jgi:hypothetical protein
MRMRKTFLLLASMSLAVLLACGVAFAAVVDCVEGEDLCVGTKDTDTLNGSEQREKSTASPATMSCSATVATTICSAARVTTR